MKFLGLITVAILFSACGGDRESQTSEERMNPDDPFGSAQADSIRLIRQEGGQPGIPGSDVPGSVWELGNGSCFAYARHVVRVVRDNESDVVDVFEGNGRELCDAPRARALFSSGATGESESFFGVSGNLVLIDQLRADERVVRVVDLAGGTVVLEAAYEEPIEIRDGSLFYGAPAAEFESQEELRAAGVECPQSPAWFEDSLAVGVSIGSRFDLASHEAALTDDITCIPLF